MSVNHEEVVAEFASVNETAGREDDWRQQQNDEFASCRSPKATSSGSVPPKREEYEEECRELASELREVDRTYNEQQFEMGIKV